MAHQIRLRAAWTRRTAPEDRSAGPRVTLPDAPQRCAAGETVIYERSFNCPSGINDRTSLRLRVPGWRGKLSLSLDGERLCDQEDESAAGLVIDLTGRLRQSHRLQLRLAPAPDDDQVQLDDIVWLEIEEPPGP
jgi:hypothetical protein